MKTQTRIGLALALTLALLAGLAPRAEAAEYTWTGSAGNGTWSDPGNWDVGGGAYPSTKDDVAVFNTTATTVTYDTGASGVLGAIRNPIDNVEVAITLQKSLLLDYTGTGGSNPTPGSWYTVGKDSGNRPRIVVNSGLTLTLNGLYHYSASATRYAGFTSLGTLAGAVVFAPDAAGKCYFGGSGSAAFRLIQGQTLEYLDFTQPAEIVVSSASGSGTLGVTPSCNTSDNNSTVVPSLRIGRTGGANQVWSSTGTGNGVQLTLSSVGNNTHYGVKLVVTASGTEASPNLISFKAGGLSGLNFPPWGNIPGGSWIEATGAGVARLVLEGDFTTSDIGVTTNLWNMSQIQVHMAGERASGSPQILTWCGKDKNAGGTLDPLTDFTGYANNYAIRKLVIGSDQGTGNNYVTYSKTTGGSAVYTWGLEITSGGYLTITDAGSYVYYLGDNSSAGGVTGTGLKLPAGKTLADVCNRPGNVILLGEMKPPSGTVVLIR